MSLPGTRRQLKAEAAVEVVVVVVGDVVVVAARGTDAPHAVRMTASAVAINPLEVM